MSQKRAVRFAGLERFAVCVVPPASTEDEALVMVHGGLEAGNRSVALKAQSCSHALVATSQLWMVTVGAGAQPNATQAQHTESLDMQRHVVANVPDGLKRFDHEAVCVDSRFCCDDGGSSLAASELKLSVTLVLLGGCAPAGIRVAECPAWSAAILHVDVECQKQRGPTCSSRRRWTQAACRGVQLIPLPLLTPSPSLRSKATTPPASKATCNQTAHSLLHTMECGGPRHHRIAFWPRSADHLSDSSTATYSGKETKGAMRTADNVKVLSFLVLTRATLSSGVFAVQDITSPLPLKASLPTTSDASGCRTATVTMTNHSSHLVDSFALVVLRPAPWWDVLVLTFVHRGAASPSSGSTSNSRSSCRTTSATVECIGHRVLPVLLPFRNPVSASGRLPRSASAASAATTSGAPLSSSSSSFSLHAVPAASGDVSSTTLWLCEWLHDEAGTIGMGTPQRRRTLASCWMGLLEHALDEGVDVRRMLQHVPSRDVSEQGNRGTGSGAPISAAPPIMQSLASRSPSPMNPLHTASGWNGVEGDSPQQPHSLLGLTAAAVPVRRPFVMTLSGSSALWLADSAVLQGVTEPAAVAARRSASPALVGDRDAVLVLPRLVECLWFWRSVAAFSPSTKDVAALSLACRVAQVALRGADIWLQALLAEESHARPSALLAGDGISSSSALPAPPCMTWHAEWRLPSVQSAQLAALIARRRSRATLERLRTTSQSMKPWVHASSVASSVDVSLDGTVCLLQRKGSSSIEAFLEGTNSASGGGSGSVQVRLALEWQPTCQALSRRGELVAFASSVDNSVWIVMIKAVGQRAELRQLILQQPTAVVHVSQAHTHSVHRMWFVSPDDSLLLTAATDGSLRVWCTVTGRLIGGLDAPAAVGHRAPCSHVLCCVPEFGSNNSKSRSSPSQVAHTADTEGKALLSTADFSPPEFLVVVLRGHLLQWLSTSTHQASGYAWEFPMRVAVPSAHTLLADRDSGVVVVLGASHFAVVDMRQRYIVAMVGSAAVDAGPTGVLKFRCGMLLPNHTEPPILAGASSSRSNLLFLGCTRRDSPLSEPTHELRLFCTARRTYIAVKSLHETPTQLVVLPHTNMLFVATTQSLLCYQFHTRDGSQQPHPSTLTFLCVVEMFWSSVERFWVVETPSFAASASASAEGVAPFVSLADCVSIHLAVHEGATVWRRSLT